MNGCFGMFATFFWNPSLLAATRRAYFAWSSSTRHAVGSCSATSSTFLSKNGTRSSSDCDMDILSAFRQMSNGM